MNIDAVIARLGEVFTTDEAAIAERMLRDYGGTIPTNNCSRRSGWRSRPTAGDRADGGQGRP